jgi:hypothetical protein
LNLRTNILRFVIALILLFTGSVTAFAAKADSFAIPNDTASMVLRQPDASYQQQVYSDDAWKYVTEDPSSSSEQSFFDRLFEDLLRSLFEDMNGPDFDPARPSSSGVSWWSLFFIVAGGGLIVFFIVKATGAGGNSLFKGKSKRKESVDATLEDVDIHAIDYDTEIADATSRQDYRFAVRLWFLRSLKEMADRKLIDWKIDKTNSDYYYELTGTRMQKAFGNVSNLYDYVWYGEFKINELRYREAEKELREFHNAIAPQEKK